MSHNEPASEFLNELKRMSSRDTAEFYYLVAKWCHENCSDGSNKGVFKRVYDYFNEINKVPHAVERMCHDYYMTFCAFVVVLKENMLKEFGKTTFYTIF